MAESDNFEDGNRDESAIVFGQEGRRREGGKERDDNESADGNISCRTLWNLQPRLFASGAFRRISSNGKSAASPFTNGEAKSIRRWPPPPLTSKSVKLLEREEGMKFRFPVFQPPPSPFSNEICHSHSPTDRKRASERPLPLQSPNSMRDRSSVRNCGGKKVRTLQARRQLASS